MADEELGVRVAVEGFEDFNKAFSDMGKRMETLAKTTDELSGTSKKSGQAMDQAGQAYDKNAARLNQLRLAMTQLDNVQEELKNETNALARAQLEVRADSLKKQIEDLSKVEQDSAQNTKKMGLSLTDLKSGIDLAVGAFNTLKSAAIKAFEFAQEGAAINATKESFDRLGMSIDKMRAASNNTIDDMGLMRSALTLMAGSSGEVADAFSGAMPQLLAMAKAANKLNPTLGDTDFMLQSIATAAKRQSSMIADNLGIIVKQEQAYKDYADSIGVAVTSLTAEQKQIAFLNGLLEAGNVLIEQAGGSTESAADSYAQLTTRVKNLTDVLKSQVAEAITPAVGAFSEHYIAIDALNQIYPEYQHHQEGLLNILTGNSQATAEYNALLEVQATDAERARLTGEAWAAALDTTNDKTIVLTDSTANSLDAFNQYMVGIDSSNVALQGLTLAQSAANDAAANAQIAFLNAAAALGEMSIASFVQAQLTALKAEMDAGTMTTQEYAAAQEALLTEFGLLTPAEKSAQGALDSLRQSAVEGKISWEAYALAAAATKRALDDIPREIGITVKYTDVGYNPGGGEHTAYQHGGTTSGRSMLVGERGPEILTGVPGGARVLSSPTAARMMAQNNTTNNYNLTTNSLTRPGGLHLEFAAMEMGSR
jgi:hypothetical protein